MIRGIRDRLDPGPGPCVVCGGGATHYGAPIDELPAGFEINEDVERRCPDCAAHANGPHWWRALRKSGYATDGTRAIREATR